MNLSKRALLLILPVVLLSFTLASAVVYDQSKQFVLRQEQERLDFATMQLGATYDRYTRSIDSYMLSITEGRFLHEFVQDTDSIELQQKLLKSLAIGLESLGPYGSDLISLSIFNTEYPYRRLIYFSGTSIGENEPSAELQSFQIQAIESGSAITWDHLTEFGQRSAIIKNQRYVPADSIDASRPIHIQVASKPNAFNQRLSQFEGDLGASFQIIDTAPNLSQLQSSANLGNGEFLLGQLSSNHLQVQMRPLIARLVLISVLFTIAASICLYWLMRRYVTRPVSILEQDLADLVARRLDELPVRQGNDEISKLSRTFGKLYGDLSHAYAETRRLMQRDTLTGLYNLGHITGSAVELLKFAKSSSSELAVIYLDLDNFKHINDKFGHRFGNTLLASFAQSIRSITNNAKDQSTHEQPAEIVLGRVGGDQFCIIVTHPTAFVIARNIAQDVLKLMADGILFEKSRFPVTVSIGIAAYPSDGDSVSHLFSNADTAMHQAKLQGKSQIAFYSEELATKARRHKEIESLLKTVDPDTEFTLVYMPLVNVRTNELDGFEALLRWESPKLGSVDPEEFVPIAEACGIFALIDEWVIRTGISSYPKLRSMLGRDFKLSLNISSAQLLMSNLIEVLDRYVQQYKVETQFIQLEITETVNIEYTPYAGAFLNALSEKGYSLALDDFGAGFTSLMRIVEYPINMVKFDKNFIAQTLKRDDRKILKPLIELCHSNGMLVTMEGAETQEDIDMLRSFDCDYIQGYFLGRPIELENMEATLAQYKKIT